MAGSSRSYNYKKPSSFNWVSALFVLGLLAGGYWLYKFAPVYYNRYQVDQILQQGRSEASGIQRLNWDSKDVVEARIINSVTEKILGRGISPEDNQLRVYFDDEYTTLNADYVVVVRHPAGKKPTTITVHRSVSLPE